MEMQFSVILLLPAASRSAVGNACATADRDPESACEPEQQTSQSRRQSERAARNVPLSISPFVFLSVLPLAAVREHAGGNIPLVACYSLLGQWEGVLD